MKKNIGITIVGIILIILAFKSVDTSRQPVKDVQSSDRLVYPGDPAPEDAPSTPTKKIWGVIMEKDDGCFSDGTCKINVSGTWVVTNQGWYQGPLGTITDDLVVGMTVEVYGKVTEDGITMLGSDSYYVKVK